MSIPCYEYIQLEMKLGDLDQLNALGSAGWHLVAYLKGEGHTDNAHTECPVYRDIALLERLVPDDKAPGVRAYYAQDKAKAQRQKAEPRLDQDV